MNREAHPGPRTACPLDPRVVLLLAVLAAVHLGIWRNAVFLSGLAGAMFLGAFAAGALQGREMKMLRGALFLGVPLALVPLLWTPGRMWIEVPGGAQITYEGLAQAGEAILRVAGFAFMAAWLSAVLPAQALGRAVAWWLGPLERIGLPVERFALVLSLTVEEVPAAAERVMEIRGKIGASPARRLDAAIGHLAGLFRGPLAQTAGPPAAPPGLPPLPKTTSLDLIAATSVAAIFAAVDGLGRPFLHP
ncbi:MAG: hypothetical protein A2V83_05835 [Nitrospirae bacterium RBG_16_64_22]|nr:MAG: hypothetical protein A2V83_05835 [Nitrospirae bacterium RBG_16_64_22]